MSSFTLWNSAIFSRTEFVSRIGVFSCFFNELFLGWFRSADDSAVRVSAAIFAVCPEDDTFSGCLLSKSLLLPRGDSPCSLHSCCDWNENQFFFSLSLSYFVPTILNILMCCWHTHFLKRNDVLRIIEELKPSLERVWNEIFCSTSNKACPLSSQRSGAIS